MTDPSPHPDLSPAARARRDAMLHGLLAELDRTRHSRATRRTILRTTLITTACIALAAAIILINLINAPTPPPRPIPAPSIAQTTTPTPCIQIIATRPSTAIQIITTRPAHTLPNVEILDDTRLLQTLAESGRPTGLITIDGHTRTTRDVTDAIGGS